MYLFKLTLLLTCLTYALCQFNLLSVPKSNRDPSRPPKVNSPNSIWKIQVGPKVKVTNESISNFAQTKPTPSPLVGLSKRSTISLTSDLRQDDLNSQPNLEAQGSRSNDLSDETVLAKKNELNSVNADSGNNLPESNTTTDLVKVGDINESKKSTDSNVTNNLNKSTAGTDSARTGRFGGFSSFGDFKPKLPGSNSLKSFGDKFKPNLPTEIPNVSNFQKFANDSVNKFKDLPIVSEFLNIPNYFKVNSLKGALDYMLKYGHLESPIDINKPQDVLNLKDAFKSFQDFFGLSKTGLFDQETLNLMNEPRCGLPDKETKLTKLISGLTGKLVRKKRYELYSVKYESTRNLTWTIMEFSKKALQNQDDKVVDVMKKAFQVWSNVTNLNFEYKAKTNTTDILIGFYSKEHGNTHVEPPFDGPNGTLAHTSYPTEWDLHLDDDENWSLYPVDKHTDLFTVSIHEIGHKLGLKHTNVKTACLFPIYNSKSTHLDRDDMEGIQSLYGVRYNKEEKEKEVIDVAATEKPEEEKDDPVDKPDEDNKDRPADNRPNDDNTSRPDNNRPDDNRPDDNRPDGNRPEDNRPDGNRPDDNRPDDNRPDGNRPEDNRPDGNRPEDNRPDGNRPDGNRPDGNRPDDNVSDSTENQAIRISNFNPKHNIHSRKEFRELTSTPCKDMNIDSSVCLRNNKCLVIAGDNHFWMNGRLKMIRRKKERNDVLFKGLTGRIDSIYRDNDLIHIIQGSNVTTYDSFYAQPINRTTLNQHFGLPAHVKQVNSVFKKLSTGVIYIYSGEFYWRYTKTYGLERLPRLVFIFGLPGNIKSVLHFNNGRSVYIKNRNYWVFDESSNQLLSYLPGNLADLNICRNENFNIFERFP